MQRPLDHCVLAAQSVPRGQQSMACWPLLVCVCVSVWMYRLSKLSGQCHRRSLQLVCLSGLVQLSVLPVSPAVLSAAWLGNAALGLMECCCADLEDLCRLAGAEPKEICTAGTAATLTRNFRAERATGNKLDSLAPGCPLCRCTHLGQQDWALSGPGRC